jgi:hypothetical protein
MASLVLVCLWFTGADVAWADDVTPEPASSADLIVPRVAPQSDYGSTARVGTAVGFVYGAPSDVLAVGFTAAAGQRFGRLGLEAEYTYLSFMAHQTIMSAYGFSDSDVGVGSGHRLALMARFDVIRLGPTVDNRRSLLTIYVEGGAGTAWNRWSKQQTDRVVPDDTKRTEGQAGFGLMIFPHRVAWLLGWRFAFTSHQPMTGSLCRGVSCSTVQMNDDGSYVDRSMLFQSSLEFTF